MYFSFATSIYSIYYFFKIKEIMGTVVNGRASLGFHLRRLWFKESTINKRKMVAEKSYHLEEVKHIAPGV